MEARSNITFKKNKMKTYTFKESEIRKAGLKNDDSFYEIKKQFFELQKLFETVGDERARRMNREKKEIATEELKALSAGSKVFLVSNNWNAVPYGSEIKKLTDRRKYMACETPVGNFNIPYLWLAITQPNESQINTNRNLAKLFRG